MSQNALIILDVVVIFCLSITIPYMFSLMKNIKSIKSGKSDLQRLVAELTASINKADKALSNMKNAIEGKGKEIEAMLNQASSVIDEMTFINKASDNLAERLGNLVTTGSQLVDDYESVSTRGGSKQGKGKKVKQEAVPAGLEEEDGDDEVFKRLEETLSRHDDLEDVFPMEEDYSSGSRSEKELAKALSGKKSQK